jgi:hypothetical protein
MNERPPSHEIGSDLTERILDSKKGVEAPPSVKTAKPLHGLSS